MNNDFRLSHTEGLGSLPKDEAQLGKFILDFVHLECLWVPRTSSTSRDETILMDQSAESFRLMDS